MASKGPIADEFRTNLFSVPLTEEFVRGVGAASDQVTRLYVQRATAGAWYKDPLTVTSITAGVLSTISGVVAMGFFFRAESDFNATDRANFDPSDTSQRVLHSRLAMTIGYTAGAVFLVTGVLRAILTNDPSEAINGLISDSQGSQVSAPGWRF